MKLNQLTVGIPIWYADETKLPISKSNIRDDITHIVERFFGQNYMDSLFSDVLPYLATDVYFSSPIYNLKDIPRWLNNDLGSKLISQYLDSFFSNLDLNIKKGRSGAIVKLNLLESFHFLNRDNIKPCDIPSVIQKLKEIFSPGTLSTHITSFLRINKPEDFANLIEEFYKVFKNDQDITLKMKDIFEYLNADIDKFFIWDASIPEVPIYIDDIHKVCLRTSTIKRNDLYKFLKEREDNISRFYGKDFINCFRKYDPISYLSLLFTENINPLFSELTKENCKRGRNIFLALDTNTKPPIFFMSPAGCSILNPWESSLENVSKFSNLPLPSELPEEAIKNDEEGRFLLKFIKDKGFFLKEKDDEPVMGFNYARVVALTKDELIKKLNSGVVTKEHAINLLNDLFDSNTDKMFDQLVLKLYNNLIDNFKSAAWFSSLLKNGEKEAAINRLKRIRSGDPALHEGNLFKNYEIFDNLTQTIDLSNFDQKAIKCKICDFYVDYCANWDPLAICEHSLLLKPFSFQETKDKMKSIGLSYTLYELFNRKDELEGIKVEEKTWKNFNVETDKSLSFYEILSLNSSLKNYTMAALLAKRIASGDMIV